MVFTGELKSLGRKEAMQKVVNLGGTLKSGVSKKTDYLIVGNQDKSLVGENGISSKEEKAAELNENGSSIKILNESEFLELIKTPNKENSFDDSNEVVDLNSTIIFNTLDDKINKLREWKLLSRTAADLKDIYYKNKNETYKCDIIGYSTKKTNLNCLSQFYETIVIKVNDKIIRIAPAYLLDMQKKDFYLSYNSVQPIIG
ncbi:BRCT domain-containing protein [Clostridium ljungdahlii]|uniref:BRCT domain-containing protein n=1 Tax=Clostridium ljungdahlii TaxID=1538 RepID=UPI0038636B4D